MADSIDKQIHVRLKAGDKRSAFSLLVQSYQERIYWHIRKMVFVHEETDDLVQETFIKVWKNMETFAGQSSWFTWVYRIATNEVLSSLRKKRIEIQDMDEHMIESLEDPMNFSGDEIETSLQKALAVLPDKQRLVFNMRYYDELPFKEIASVLELSEGGVKSNYHHAAKKVEAFIKVNY